MFYNLTDREGEATISLFFDDSTAKVVPANHPNFARILGLLTSGDYTEHDVVRLVDPTVGIGEDMAEIAGDRVTFDLHNLYFDGKPLHSAIAQHIKDKINAGDDDWKRLVRFLIHLDENPSYKAQQATYAWVARTGLTITEDGCFLGYKAVLHDHTSSSTGPDNYINGQYYGEPGESYHVPHHVGDVISKKRGDVDDTPGGGCSVGLHVGTYDYAKGFAPVLMTVKVNPRDVVSAPGDHGSDWKIRVCRYEVVALNEKQVDFIGKEDTTSYDVETGEVLEVAPDDLTDGSVVAWAIEHPVKSRHHEWDAGQQADYDSLNARGRTLYDNLRTQFDWDHDYAFDRASVEFGLFEPFAGEQEDDLETYREIPTLDQEDVEEESQETVQEASATLTLAENAALLPDLKKALHDSSIGHKTLAKDWAHLTTESSVRRYRKSNGISLNLKAKIKG